MVQTNTTRQPPRITLKNIFKFPIEYLIQNPDICKLF